MTVNAPKARGNLQVVAGVTKKPDLSDPVLRAKLAKAGWCPLMTPVCLPRCPSPSSPPLPPPLLLLLPLLLLPCSCYLSLPPSFVKLVIPFVDDAIAHVYTPSHATVLALTNRR